jgi:hypothetical protein
MPIFIDVLLTKYGQRTTLLAMAALLAASVIPTFPYIKPRTPAAQSTATPSINWSFLRSGPFYILFIGNFLQGLGNFIPGTYLPSASCSPRPCRRCSLCLFVTAFFSDNNLGTTAGTLAVSLMNGRFASSPIVNTTDCNYNKLFNSLFSPRKYIFRLGDRSL